MAERNGFFLLSQMDCGDAQLKLNRIERKVIHCRTIFYSHHWCARWLQSLFCRRDRQSNERRRESNARKTLKHTNNNKSNNKSGKCLARDDVRRTEELQTLKWSNDSITTQNTKMNEHKRNERKIVLQEKTPIRITAKRKTRRERKRERNSFCSDQKVNK